MNPATPAQALFLRLATQAKIHERLDRIADSLVQEEIEWHLRDAVDEAAVQRKISELRF